MNISALRTSRSIKRSKIRHIKKQKKSSALSELAYDDKAQSKTHKETRISTFWSAQSLARLRVQSNSKKLNRQSGKLIITLLRNARSHWTKHPISEAKNSRKFAWLAFTFIRIPSNSFSESLKQFRAKDQKTEKLAAFWDLHMTCLYKAEETHIGSGKNKFYFFSRIFIKRFQLFSYDS